MRDYTPAKIVIRYIMTLLIHNITDGGQTISYIYYACCYCIYALIMYEWVKSFFILCDYKWQSPIGKHNLKKKKKQKRTCRARCLHRGSATTRPNLRLLYKVLPLSEIGGYRVVRFRNDIWLYIMYIYNIYPSVCNIK